MYETQQDMAPPPYSSIDTPVPDSSITASCKGKGCTVVQSVVYTLNERDEACEAARTAAATTVHQNGTISPHHWARKVRMCIRGVIRRKEPAPGPESLVNDLKSSWHGPNTSDNNVSSHVWDRPPAWLRASAVQVKELTPGPLVDDIQSSWQSPMSSDDDVSNHVWDRPPRWLCGFAVHMPDQQRGHSSQRWASRLTACLRWKIDKPGQPRQHENASRQGSQQAELHIPDFYEMV
ncbi:hypothetical protein LTR56_006987 [Elasticomyces elasticus]|nr:hypothetical protein LTR56_006987 [Elasticomyces elasticus]KAK3664144.1 hypothetical protein LTR22_005109 [Elasticomyces elasticus]KAK4927713.1 hypothetical protein LTR49_005583 [Elasticomyces elasticus]KAK5767084.1 hypothetical protein LTS12_002850 [Elasticomyces elasticus]